jgi:hypothetical protein
MPLRPSPAVARSRGSFVHGVLPILAYAQPDEVHTPMSRRDDAPGLRLRQRPGDRVLDQLRDDPAMVCGLGLHEGDGKIADYSA